MSTVASSTIDKATQITLGIVLRDPLAAYWIGQVNLRLRRELAWCWRLRAGSVQPGADAIAPVVNGAAEAVNWVRYQDEKKQFFAQDVAAVFLSEKIAQTAPRKQANRQRGAWLWLSETLGLRDAEQFVLALALAARMDAGLTPVFASVMNDLNRPFASLALAQRLWDEPLAIIQCADPSHVFYRFGIFTLPELPQHTFIEPLSLNYGVVTALINPDAPLPANLQPVSGGSAAEFNLGAQALSALLKSQTVARQQIVPLLGEHDSDFSSWAANLSQACGGELITVRENYPLPSHELAQVALCCWLRGTDLLLPLQSVPRAVDGIIALPLPELPLRWFVPFSDRVHLRQLAQHFCMPHLEIPALDFSGRQVFLKKALGRSAKRLAPDIEECARRFRFQQHTLLRVAHTVNAMSKIDGNHLFEACRNETAGELDGLAERVIPRFKKDELILSAAQQQQFNEILQAMLNLTKVHYHWGTAKAWNESGLSVLFSGPPGTGKTMAAEVLSAALHLPMYRIDLSQVVNKYIGETEKNLKRIFDAAERSDCVLFFDEADALFGKRTEVKDAHDRFANIEISYLLERMERFKGLAILATNRRKDLDEAFLRRLRYIIEFPLPGETERVRIWQSVFPTKVDIQELDIAFLAKQFQLTGGNIRSVAFNACLQSAQHGDGKKPKIGMAAVLVAVKRELEKMDRVANEHLFGQYQVLLREVSI